ncbi:hypothetical protein KU374_22405, partial [Salmonella enterica subsp. enterica serovar Give]|nr:hypothetical protein [Salmonella enterica subsp. enterica serovar Give]
SEDHGVLIIIAIMIGMLFVQPVMGLLSDRFGRRPFVIMGSIADCLCADPFIKAAIVPTTLRILCIIAAFFGDLPFLGAFAPA